MRAWFDCEFCSFDDVRPISIGIVVEDGRESYEEYCFDAAKCSAWVREHVIPRLGGGGSLDLEGVSELICDTSYDERIIRELGIDIPVRQVKQLPEQERKRLFTHHALEDARVLHSLYP